MSQVVLKFKGSASCARVGADLAGIGIEIACVECEEQAIVDRPVGN